MAKKRKKKYIYIYKNKIKQKDLGWFLRSERHQGFSAPSGFWSLKRDKKKGKKSPNPDFLQCFKLFPCRTKAKGLFSPPGVVLTFVGGEFKASRSFGVFSPQNPFLGDKNCGEKMGKIRKKKEKIWILLECL